MKHESDLLPERFFRRGGSCWLCTLRSHSHTAAGAASRPSRHNAGRAEARHLSAYTRSRVVRENAVDSFGFDKTSRRIYGTVSVACTRPYRVYVLNWVCLSGSAGTVTQRSSTRLPFPRTRPVGIGGIPRNATLVAIVRTTSAPFKIFDRAVRTAPARGRFPRVALARSRLPPALRTRAWATSVSNPLPPARCTRSRPHEQPSRPELILPSHRRDEDVTTRWGRDRRPGHARTCQMCQKAPAVTESSHTSLHAALGAGRRLPIASTETPQMQYRRVDLSGLDGLAQACSPRPLWACSLSQRTREDSPCKYAIQLRCS